MLILVVLKSCTMWHSDWENELYSKNCLSIFRSSHHSLSENKMFTKSALHKSWLNFLQNVCFPCVHWENLATEYLVSKSFRNLLSLVCGGLGDPHKMSACDVHLNSPNNQPIWMGCSQLQHWELMRELL